LENPITKREVRDLQKLYGKILEREGNICCVWTGKLISKYEVDHIIPFSIWKNNDLWNLLPSDPATNNRKRDKIPSPALIEKRKDVILYYWELIREQLPERFRKEVQVTLLGKEPFCGWQETAINQLQSNCRYLITNRGYEEWKI
jgi:CRISPR/Cas system Type II protein with McrA/HNH and RuvC-like nuclease domain